MTLYMFVSVAVSLICHVRAMRPDAVYTELVPAILFRCYTDIRINVSFEDGEDGLCIGLFACFLVVSKNKF